MDIGSKSGYPSSSLSNFAPHAFVLDEVQCASMEGFLQSLKFSNPDMQVEVCKLVGITAKRRGSKKNWKTTQTLYWRGKPYKRDSEDYQKLLDKAYYALSQNASFQRALLATGNSSLTHSIGKNKINETVLTVQEFTSRLYKLRNELQQKQK